MGNGKAEPTFRETVVYARWPYPRTLGPIRILWIAASVRTLSPCREPSSNPIRSSLVHHSIMSGAHCSQYFAPHGKAELTFTEASATALSLPAESPSCPRMARTQAVLARPVEDSLRRTAAKYERATTLPARRNAACLSTVHESRYRRAEEVNEEVCPPRTVFAKRSDFLRVSTHRHDEVRRDKRSHHRFSTYPADKLKFMECLSPDDLLNHFREQSSSHKFGVSKKKIHMKDYTVFGDAYTTKQFGGLAVNLKRGDPTHPFSYKTLLESTLRIAQVDIQAFDMKIVETGALIRAFQDSKIISPGIPSVLSLLKKCRNAACLNSDPWVLSSTQLRKILGEALPWHDKRSTDRLLIAHDPKRSGFIRYIRIFLPVIAYFSPLVNDYTSYVELDLHGIPYSNVYLLLGLYYDVYVSSEASGGIQETKNVSSAIIEEDEDRSTLRKHFTGVENDCFPKSGFNRVEKSDSNGILVDNICEALTCCSCDKLDLQKMNELVSMVLKVSVKTTCTLKTYYGSPCRTYAFPTSFMNRTQRYGHHPL